MDAHNASMVARPAGAVLAWIGVIFGYVGVESWRDGAAMVATFYTLLLIAEWVWKHTKAWRIK